MSCWTHLLGAGAALLLAPLLLRAVSEAQRAGVAIFAAFVVILLSMSGVFHLLEPGGAPRSVFLRLDHAAIWLLIAGTITPMLLMGFRGRRRSVGLSILWTSTITGLTLKTIFFEGFPEWLSLSLYLGLGWIGVMGAWDLTRRLGRRSQRWLFRGGVVYSLGALFDFACVPIIIPNVMGPHEFFHLCVLGGVACHWRYVIDLARCTATPTSADIMGTCLSDGPAQVNA